MFLSIALIIILVGIYLCTRRFAKTVPPGPRGWPLVGVAFEKDITRKPHIVMTKWAAQFGPLFAFKSLGKNVLVLNNADLVRKAFAGKGFHMAMNDRPHSFAAEYIFFGYKDMEFTKHRGAMRYRKIIHKGLNFYGEGVQRSEQLFVREAHRFLEELMKTKGLAVDPGPIIETSICMLTSLQLTGACSKQAASQTRHLLHGFVNAVLDALSPMSNILLPVLRLFPGKYRTIYLTALALRDRSMDEFFHEQKASFDGGQDRGFMDVLFRIQREQEKDQSCDSPLADDHIKSLLMILLIAGIDTSSATLTWTLLVLLNNPDCIRRIRHEVDNVVGSDRFPSSADMGRMPYTVATIMETLRYISTAPLLVPHCCGKDVNFEGYDIAKGTLIFVNAWSIHHDETIWGDPWVFRPDRFLDETGQLVSAQHKTRQSFLAFGYGDRKCAGQALGKARVFLYLTTLVQRFDIEPSVPLTAADPRNVEGRLELKTPPFTCNFIPRF